MADPSLSSSCWWLFTLGTVCPRSYLLSCSVVTLRCLPWNRHLGSSAPGYQLLVAGRKPLLISRDWSPLRKHLGRGRQRLDGWRSRRTGDVGVPHWGIVCMQEKGKRITRWKMIARAREWGHWWLTEVFCISPPYLMCFHLVWWDVSTAWVVWNLCGCSSK